MAGYWQVTKALEGRYIELKSNASGKVWRGRVKRVTYKDSEGKEPKRRILFDDGREVTAHENFSFTAKQLG